MPLRGAIYVKIKASSTGQYVYALEASNAPLPALYRSDDYGVTWNPTTSTFYNYFDVAISDSGQYAIAITHTSGNIDASSDYGVTWTRASILPFYYSEWSSVAISGSGQIAYVVAGDGIDKEAFPGAWWFSVKTSNSGQYLYLETDNNIYFSPDFGVTYSIISQVFAFIETTDTGSTLYGGYQTNLFKSVDYGITFILAYTFSSNIGDFAISSTGQIVYVAISEGIIYKSTDYGNSFSSSLSSSLPFYSIACSDDGTYVYASLPDNDGSVYKSPASPTNSPTSTPTTYSPTLFPTATPSSSPTISPTNLPTVSPTWCYQVCPPTPSPSTKPTNNPTFKPTVLPTIAPSFIPTRSPTPSPSLKPTFSPTYKPLSIQLTCDNYDSVNSKINCGKYKGRPNTITLDCGNGLIVQALADCSQGTIAYSNSTYSV
eukprot:gene20332-26393_t